MKRRGLGVALVVVAAAVVPTVVGVERASAAGVSIAVGDVSVWEGDTGTPRSGSLALTLSEAAATTVTVQYSLAAGSASAGQDFKSFNLFKTATFNAGVVKKFIPVNVYPDTNDEGDETFNITLANPTGGATIDDADGLVSILDDDPNTELGVTVSDASVWEGDDSKPRAIKLWVSLTDPAPSTVTVTATTVSGTATAGVDYKPVSKLVTFKIGQTKKPILVTTYPDTTYEGDETFTISLSGATGATLVDSFGTGTIRDDEVPPPPVINTIDPAQGPAGTTVTITGSNFTGATVVMFGAIAAENFTIVSDAEITAVSPSQPSGPVDLTVTNPSGSSNSASFIHEAPSVLGGVVGVTAGGNHSCAVLAGGSVRCWGSNAWGQLGAGGISGSSTPISVAGVASAVQVSAGRAHSCAVLAGGDVTCWGYNIYGQLGDGSTNSSSDPVQVQGIANAVKVASGGDHSCALLGDGSVKCWGFNGAGQLGDGTTTNFSATPVIVSGIVGAIDVSAGWTHSCGVRDDGGVECWGYNWYGQLGNDSTIESRVPVEVAGIVDAAAVALGQDHSCALLDDGSVKCWGYNSYGQIGSGAASYFSKIPVSVSELTGVTRISAGLAHSCALLVDSTVSCWGSNENGQGGTGMTSIYSPTPAPVSGMTAATDVGGGGAHTCALVIDGSLRCWGYNLDGQLGNGTATTALLPVAVLEG